MEGMTLEKLQVIIEAYTKPYEEELEKVKQKTEKVMLEVEQKTSKTSTSVSSRMNRVGGIIRKALGVVGVAAILAFGKSCIDLGSDLAEVQNVVDVTFRSMSERVDTFSKNAITQFGLSELAAKQYMGTYGAMAKSFGIVGEAGYQMSAAITGLTGDVASFYNRSPDEAYTKLKSIFTGETESLKDLGVVMTQTALDQYALNNGFGKTTAKMTEQEKVMLRYRFVMSSLSDASGDFARTSEGWANQTRILSLQFQSLKATIGQGLINAFTPVIRVINTLMAKMQILAGYFKSFTIALFGDANAGNSMSDSMGSAADSSGTVADNMNNAANAAKKMKDYTLGIDELNILNTEDDSGSGSGDGAGGSGSLDWGNLGESWTDAFEPDVNEMVEKICKAFENGDYRLAGSYIGDGIANALRSIDWDSIYASADQFGWGLADFLNGLISPNLFGAVGETVAGSLNTALHFLDSFGTTFEWYGFGESIAAGVNSFFKTYDFKLAASALNHLVDGVKESIRGAVENLSWNDILAGVSDFLGTLEIDTIEVIIGAILIKNKIPSLLAASLAASLSSGVPLSSLLISIGTFVLSEASLPALQVIGNQIIDEIDKFILENFGESVGNAMGESILLLVAGGFGFILGGPIGAVIGIAIGMALDTFVVKGEWATKFWKKINDLLFNFDFANALLEASKGFFEKAFNAENFWEFGANIIAGIASGITAGFAFLLEPFGDLLDFVIETICNVFGIHSPASEMKPYGKYILQGIIEGFKNTFSEWDDSLNEWYDTHISPWFTKQKWSELYSTIKKELKRTWDETVGEWKTGVNNWWNQNVSPWFTLTKWSNLYETVKVQLRKKWGETVGEWKEGTSSWWTNDVSPWFTAERWMNVYESIKTSMKARWGETESAWKQDIENWWSQHVSPWFTLEKWTEMMRKVPDAFKNIFTSAVNGGIAIFNKFIDWINDHMEFEWDDIEIAGQTIVSGGSVQLFTIPHIPTFATGGFPEDGLFMANHGELIGSFSGGRTAVANNEQIISGIQRGVSEASREQNQLLREQNQLLRDLLEKDTVIEMDSRVVGKTMNASDRRGGYKLRTT